MGSGTRLNYAKRKYGLEFFKKDILKECNSQSEMEAYEASIVTEDFLKRKDVYNLRLGGLHLWDGSPRRSRKKHHPLPKHKTSSRVFSVEARKKLSELHKGNQYAVGAIRSDEHKIAISESQKGNKHAVGSVRSDEHKLAVSKAHTGRVFSEETKRKMSEAKKGNKNAAGHKLSEESLLKISIAKKGRPRKNPEMIHKVLCDTQKS
jgi:hypothetical protein